MVTRPLPSHQLLGLERLISLIDGVFAVAMTLLILDLRLPSQSGDLVRALLQMLPGFLIYLVVFASISGYWFMHHITFRHIAQGDARLVWLSLINLLFVTLFPVTASIVGGYPLEPLATVCLSANCLLYCMSAWAIWSYAAANRQFLVEDASHLQLEQVARIMLLVALGLAFAIPFAFLSVYLTYAIWILWSPIVGWWVRGRGQATT